ncbi:cytochrome b/b6 domain-containing protein [Ponticaulis profundi]|uniref:Cytochrome b/b6 domain-containing protein n=1 Tax=Ponticaulis profundi TaxID=2665222 RepID=A0ABW1S613_9PROT
MTEESGLAAPKEKVSVWDGVTRIWHWLTAILIVAMWFTADGPTMNIHITLGIVLVGLLVFRISWGIWGSSTARFSNFVKGPGAIISYLKKLKDPNYKASIGHNPLGALSVLALMALIAAQLGTGLFATDTDGMNSGPLARFIDYDTSRALIDVHELIFRGIQAMVVLHLVAIAFYLVVKKTNLARAMVTGKLPAEQTDATKAELKKPGPVALVISLVIGAGVSALLFNL